MLRKMLKYDIKDSFFEILVLGGILIGVALLSLLSIKLENWSFFSITMTAFGIVMAAILVMTMRAIVRNFHTKLFTNNGYLTLTTPVSIDKILISKILASMLCVLASVFLLSVSLLIILSSTLNVGMDFSVLAYMGKTLFDRPWEFVKNAIFVLAYCLYAMVMLLFVLTLTNTGRMKKHKWLKGILIYIILAIALQMLWRIRVFSNEWFGLGLNLALSTGFYFASRYTIVNKLELE